MTEASRRVRVLFDEAAIARRNAEIAEAIVAAKPENLLVVRLERAPCWRVCRSSTAACGS